MDDCDVDCVVIVVIVVSDDNDDTHDDTHDDNSDGTPDTPTTPHHPPATAYPTTSTSCVVVCKITSSMLFDCVKILFGVLFHTRSATPTIMIQPLLSCGRLPAAPRVLRGVLRTKHRLCPCPALCVVGVSGMCVVAAHIC